jgi:serine/threonine-protein kinase
MKCPSCQNDVEDSADRCFHCGHVLRASTQFIRGSKLASGRYEILAPLGKGGMGMVYKAHDHELDETVAIKVLRTDVASDPDMIRRFRTEIRLARKVRHRNVCGIYEFGEDAGVRFIAMEYIEGVDLRKVLNEVGCLDPAAAFDTCIHVAQGLQAIHEAGIVHRDLKTANLMRDGQGVVRLMDFGIAKQVGDASHGQTATGLVVGTPEYMSPEQARGEKIDQRSDIYALGIVAFEVFTGRVPFRGETPIATIFKHLQDPPPLEGPDAPPLPEALIPVLYHALAKKPEERIGSAAEFAMAMVQARDASGYTATPTSPIPAIAPSSPTPRPMPTVTPGSAPTRIGAPQTSTGNTGATSIVPPPVPRARTPQPPPLVDRGSGPTRVTPQRPPAKSGLPIALIGGAGAMVLVAVAIGVVLWLNRPKPEPVVSPLPSTLPTPGPSTPGPGPAAGGTLVIDALPWAEVVSVTDDKGAAQPLGASHTTPLLVALPPGRYTVELRNPGFPKPQSAEVTIRAGETTTRILEFRRVDAADYFKRTGL